MEQVSAQRLLPVELLGKCLYGARELKNICASEVTLTPTDYKGLAVGFLPSSVRRIARVARGDPA